MKKYWYVWAVVFLGVAYLAWDLFFRKKDQTTDDKQTTDSKDPPAKTTPTESAVSPAEAKLRQARLNMLLNAYQILGKVDVKRVSALDMLSLSPALPRVATTSTMKPIAEDGVWGPQSSSRAIALTSSATTNADGILEQFKRIRSLIYRVKDAIPSPLDLGKLAIPGERDWIQEEAKKSLTKLGDPRIAAGSYPLGGNLNRFDGGLFFN